MSQDSWESSFSFQEYYNDTRIGAYIVYWIKYKYWCLHSILNQIWKRGPTAQKWEQINTQRSFNLIDALYPPIRRSINSTSLETSIWDGIFWLLLIIWVGSKVQFLNTPKPSFWASKSLESLMSGSTRKVYWKIHQRLLRL